MSASRPRYHFVNAGQNGGVLDKEQSEDEITGGSTQSKHRALAEAKSGFALLWLSWKERRYARDAARKAVLSFQRVRGTNSTLEKKDLYAAWVMDQSGCAEAEARRVVRQASVSFAEWPNDRDLAFRHIVQYFVVADYLHRNRGHAGTSANMVAEIARYVPQDL